MEMETEMEREREREREREGEGERECSRRRSRVCFRLFRALVVLEHYFRMCSKIFLQQRQRFGAVRDFIFLRLVHLSKPICVRKRGEKEEDEE